MELNELSGRIVDAAVQVHQALGPGLLESVYEKVLSHELERRGLDVVRQKPIPIRYAQLVFDEGFRADMIVDGRVILELKSVESLNNIHKKQLLTYLRLTGLHLGLLLNFGSDLMKRGIVRIANNLPPDTPG